MAEPHRTQRLLRGLCGSGGPSVPSSWPTPGCRARSIGSLRVKRGRKCGRNTAGGIGRPSSGGSRRGVASESLVEYHHRPLARRLFGVYGDLQFEVAIRVHRKNRRCFAGYGVMSGTDGGSGVTLNASRMKASRSESGSCDRSCEMMREPVMNTSNACTRGSGSSGAVMAMTGLPSVLAKPISKTDRVTLHYMAARVERQHHARDKERSVWATWGPGTGAAITYGRLPLLYHSSATRARPLCGRAGPFSRLASCAARTLRAAVRHGGTLAKNPLRVS